VKPTVFQVHVSPIQAAWSVHDSEPGDIVKYEYSTSAPLGHVALAFTFAG
jgi:membrane-associated phospholipid phosphatase